MSVAIGFSDRCSECGHRGWMHTKAALRKRWYRQRAPFLLFGVAAALFITGSFVLIRMNRRALAVVIPAAPSPAPLNSDEFNLLFGHEAKSERARNYGLVGNDPMAEKMPEPTLGENE